MAATSWAGSSERSANDGTAKGWQQKLAKKDEAFSSRLLHWLEF
jgi:hypothetical protein